MPSNHLRTHQNIVIFNLIPTIAALLLTGTAALRAAPPADELIAMGDVFYAKLQAAQALKYYLPAEKLDPNNVRLLEHISREYRHLMMDATSAQEKLSLGSTAVNYAKRAASLNPGDPEAQLAVAISYGKMEPFESNREKFEAVHIIKNAVDKAIGLDPNNDLGWHVLGRWHEGLAQVNPVMRAMAQVALGKLPDSTHQEAATCFEKAIALNPNRLMHYIELGLVYAKMGRPDDARHCIKTGLSMPNTEKDDAEIKREGREALTNLR